MVIFAVTKLLSRIQSYWTSSALSSALYFKNIYIFLTECDQFDLDLKNIFPGFSTKGFVLFCFRVLLWSFLFLFCFCFFILASWAGAEGDLRSRFFFLSFFFFLSLRGMKRGARNCRLEGMGVRDLERGIWWSSSEIALVGIIKGKGKRSWFPALGCKTPAPPRLC